MHHSVPDSPRIPRIELIDIARGVALIAMAIYHFGWDLEFFRYLPPGAAEHGAWKLFARCIASSFLILVGISLFLAHARDFRWRSFWRRLILVAAAAAAITVVTLLAVPGGFIFFGILHEIAVASVLGLAFIRLPAMVTLIAAAFVIGLPHVFTSPFFDHPALLWVGLSTSVPHSNDYVPVFPWFGAVLIGIAAARLARSDRLLTRLAAIRSGAWSKPLKFFGHHSLIFYLLHQPVLIACVWLFGQLFPAPVVPPAANFMHACSTQCLDRRDRSFCTRYCECALDQARSQKFLNDLFAATPTAETSRKMGEVAEYCSDATDFPPPPKGQDNDQG